MKRQMFTTSQFRSIEVKAKAKSGRYMTLAVPSVMILCPVCNGRGIPNDRYSCECCEGQRVLEVISSDFLAQYPKIDKAMQRYDLEKQRDAWETYGERIWGC